MRLHILGYLHLEFAPIQIPRLDADVVLLSGDIHLVQAGIQWVRMQFPNTPVHGLAEEKAQPTRSKENCRRDAPRSQPAVGATISPEQSAERRVRFQPRQPGRTKPGAALDPWAHASQRGL